MEKRPTLDLHGVKHEDVFYTVKRFVEDVFRHGAEGNYKIITGNSRRMREIVIEELDRYNVFGHYIEPGMIIIYSKEY